MEQTNSHRILFTCKQENTLWNKMKQKNADEHQRHKKKATTSHLSKHKDIYCWLRSKREIQFISRWIFIHTYFILYKQIHTITFRFTIGICYRKYNQISCCTCYFFFFIYSINSELNATIQQILRFQTMSVSKRKREIKRLLKLALCNIGRA